MGTSWWPSLAGVVLIDFGPTDPMWTLPQGTAVRVDPTMRTVTSLQPADL